MAIAEDVRCNGRCDEVVVLEVVKIGGSEIYLKARNSIVLMPTKQGLSSVLSRNRSPLWADHQAVFYFTNHGTLPLKPQNIVRMLVGCSSCQRHSISSFQ